MVENLKMGRTSCSANSCHSSFARHLGEGPPMPPFVQVCDKEHCLLEWR